MREVVLVCLEKLGCPKKVTGLVSLAKMVTKETPSRAPTVKVSSYNKVEQALPIDFSYAF